MSNNKWFDKLIFDSLGNLKVRSQTVNKLIWQNDVDFNKGMLTTVEVDGSDDAAKLQPTNITDLDDDVDYETAGNYTPSDGAKIEVASGAARLKALAGSSTDYPFTTPGNYTLSDATKIQVLDGEAILRVTNVIGHWHLNESTGSTVSDDSGNGNDGTATNMENGDWVTGKLNNGLVFGGTDEWVDLGAIADFERTDSFSLEFWFNTTTSSAQMILSKQLNAGTYRGWNVFIESGLITAALISDNASSNRLQKKTNSTFNDGSWHHCVVTYDGSSTLAGLLIYMDGSLAASTNVTDNLSATISHATNAQISGRAGANVVFVGTVDEVVIYNFTLTSGNVTSRYNSGTGTEVLVGSYPTDDPTILNATGLVFTAALSGFTETATKTDSEIKYHVSDDDGVTWQYWTGSAWAVTDDTYAQANTAADVNTNIPTLASSGTFKFRALLHSNDGSDSPMLDNINVAEANTFSTTDDLYVDTKDAAQLSVSDVTAWLTATITNNKPTNTDIRVLFSVDGRTNWLTWSGSAWVAPASATTRTDATSVVDAQTNFASLELGSTLDVRVFLQTADDTVRPTVSNINVTGDKGFETSGNWESNIYNSDNSSQEWGKAYFTVTLPSGTTISVVGKASNKSDLTDASYGSALTHAAETELVGQYVQFKVSFTGTTAARAELDDLAVVFQTNDEPDVSP